MPICRILQGAKGVACVVLVAALAGQSLGQDTRGFNFFNNLSVSPYVSFEYMYDSNVNYDQEEVDDNILSVQPGVDLSYKHNEWGITGNAWFVYDWYAQESDLNADRYGESLEACWESHKGLGIVLGQSYMKTSQNDSLVDGGRGLWRDREEVDFTGALSYDFSERMSATLNAQYSELAYANSVRDYLSLYGWQEWSVGLELARKISAKTDILVAGSYQEYTSDGAVGIGSGSTGYTLQAGVSSQPTDRIRCHALTGASWFDYGGTDQLVGWTYSVDASWQINKKWAATLAGSSCFQPSEVSQNSAVQVSALNAGLTYRPMERLTTRLDFAYRREVSEFVDASSGSVTEDTYAARIRADYRLRRFVTLYSYVDYENDMSDVSINEYNRTRIAVGMNVRY